MRILSTPARRWLAPVAVLALVGGTGLVAATATADNKLPARTAQQLLVDVQNARVDGLSGTVVQRADLGIPAIPGGDGSDSSDLTSLVSGTHTLRVRYSAPDKQRIALFSTNAESDVIRNGKDLWAWSSEKNEATHRTLPSERTDEPAGAPSGAPTTPEEAAQKVLAALDPTTTVTTDSAVKIDGRDAYELVLDPNDDASLIGQVRVAVDGETKMPLRVQVYSHTDQLAFEVGYTSVSFTRPDDAEFAFNPPPGAKVTEEAAPEKPSTDDQKAAEQKAAEAKSRTTTVGTGWRTVTILTGDGAVSTVDNPQLQAFLSKLPVESGSWGSGRVLSGTVFSAVLTDDGRVAIGAVAPSVLYDALAK